MPPDDSAPSPSGYGQVDPAAHNTAKAQRLMLIDDVTPKIADAVKLLRAVRLEIVSDGRFCPQCIKADEEIEVLKRRLAVAQLVDMSQSLELCNHFRARAEYAEEELAKCRR